MSFAADGTCIVINNADQIWRWNQMRNDWDPMPGALTCCSVGSAQQIWGCNRQEEIFYWSGSDWVKVDGACVQISVGSDGAVWCCNSADQVWRRMGPNGRWEQIQGALTCVSVSDAHTVIGNNRAGEIWSWNGMSWNKMPGATVHISTGAYGHSHVWGVNSAQEVWRHGCA